jgi:hypothetical protein
VKLIFAVLCESAAIDRQTNRVSMFNVIEEVTATVGTPGQTLPNLPDDRVLVPMLTELVALFERSSEDTPESQVARVRVRHATAEQSLAFTNEVAIDLSKHLRVRAQFKLPGIVVRPQDLAAPGAFRMEYQIEVKAEDDWNLIFALPLRFTVQISETAPQLEFSQDP